MFRLAEEEGMRSAKIKVVGVGGCGCNAVNTLIASRLDGVDYVALNTDNQALVTSLAGTKLQIGLKVTRGLGAGADPQKGLEAAREDTGRIRETMAGADLVFVTAGMGGGTGTGAAPVVATLAREVGALTVAVVTKPFQFEGSRRMRVAEEGLYHLKKACDTLIVVPNERLLKVLPKTVSWVDALRSANDVLRQAVEGIAELILKPGLINVDLADVRTVMSNMGRAVMGRGTSTGINRAMDAARRAVSSPLLEDGSIKGARGVLINITGGEDLTLHEVGQATSYIQEVAHPEAVIIVGSVVRKGECEEAAVTVIATGFEQETGEFPANVPSFGRTLPLGISQEISGKEKEEEWDIPTFVRRKIEGEPRLF